MNGSSRHRNLNDHNEVSRTMKELFRTLDQQVQLNISSISKLQESSDLVSKTIDQFNRVGSTLSQTFKLFQRIRRTNNLQKYIFYLTLFVYILTCSIVIIRRITPTFIYDSLFDSNVDL
jgi:hypothetical protein